MKSIKFLRRSDSYGMIPATSLQVYKKAEVETCFAYYELQRSTIIMIFRKGLKRPLPPRVSSSLVLGLVRSPRIKGRRAETARMQTEGRQKSF